MSTQVLTRNHRVYSNQAFTGTLGPANIPVDHIIELDYSCPVYDHKAGACTVTLAHMKQLIDEVIMNLGGREIVRLDNHDVTDLANLWMGQTPQVYLTAAAGAIMQIEPMTIPLSLDKELDHALRTLELQFTYGTLADEVQDPVIYANVPYISNQNVSWLPEGMHYAYQYKTFTPSTTEQTVLFPRKGADLIGLLVYNAHPPTTAVANDIDYLTVYVNNQPVYGPVYWHTMRTFQGTQDIADDAVWGAESWLYRYLDFSKAPLPADFLDIATQSVTNTTGPCRFIGVFIEP